MRSLVDSHFQGLYDALEKAQFTGPQGEKFSRAEGYERTLNLALQAGESGAKIMFIGNGGSAAIASHMAIDFSKNGGMPAMCFNDAAALTCVGNDFGYEEVFAQQMRYHARPADVLFAISSSGASASILRAVAVARARECAVITLSGFRADNPLRILGDVNFHVGLSDYGLVEVAHTALIHAVVDLKLASLLLANVQVAD